MRQDAAGAAAVASAGGARAGTQFTCFTSTKLQILTPGADDSQRPRDPRQVRRRGTHFTCFTGTKVQILTPEELHARQRRKSARSLRRLRPSGRRLATRRQAKKNKNNHQFTCVASTKAHCLRRLRLSARLLATRGQEGASLYLLY